jgi:hypothetical protein
MSDGSPRSGRAVIGSSPTTYGDYAEAYLEAARCLVDDAIAGRSRADALVYPVAYTFRHALELALKDGNRWVESWINAKVQTRQLGRAMHLTAEVVHNEIKGHRLMPLAERLQTRLALIADVEWLNNSVMTAIAAFDIFDVDAQRFRYPFQTQGRGASFKAGRDFRVIDLLRLREAVVGAVHFLLHGLRDMLNSDLQEVIDLNRAWQRELAEIQRKEHDSRRLFTYSAAAANDPDDLGENYLLRWELGPASDRAAEMLDDGDDDPEFEEFPDLRDE